MLIFLGKGVQTLKHTSNDTKMTALVEHVLGAAFLPWDRNRFFHYGENSGASVCSHHFSWVLSVLF